MRKLQKPPVKEVKTSKKEPLAEGLQIVVPTSPSGRRLWSKMSDNDIVEYAKRVMGENGISIRSKLEKADCGLHRVLLKRKLLGNIEFEEKFRSWKDMDDEEIVEFTKKLMKEKEITGRTELNRADSGLYNVLKKRGLFEKVGFIEKRKKGRSWKGMGDDEVIELAKRTIEEVKIIRKNELRKTDKGLYEVLRKRRLFDRAFARIDIQRKDSARDAVIDALTKFANSENSEVDVA